MAIKRKGFTLVELLVVIAIIGLLTSLLLPAVQAARESARKTKCLNNLTQIYKAIVAYEGAKNGLPPAFASWSFPGNPAAVPEGWPWTVWLLPYLEQAALYKDLLRTGLLDPANHPHISTYTCPANEVINTAPQLSYGANMGIPDTVGDSRDAGLFHDWTIGKVQWTFDRLASADGTAFTLLVTEKLVPEGSALLPHPFGIRWDGIKESQIGVWWNPLDGGIGGHLQFDGSRMFYPSSAHPGGYGQSSTAFHILFADGRVVFITKPITLVENLAPIPPPPPAPGPDNWDGVYRHLLTPNGRSAYREDKVTGAHLGLD